MHYFHPYAILVCLLIKGSLIHEILDSRSTFLDKISDCCSVSCLRFFKRTSRPTQTTPTIATEAATTAMKGNGCASEDDEVGLVWSLKSEFDKVRHSD